MLQSLRGDAEALAEITIAGRAFRIGKVDEAMRGQAKPFLTFLERAHIAGADLSGEKIRRAKAEIAALLLKEHAADITAEWLAAHWNECQREAVVDEFHRQTVDLVRAGLMFRAVPRPQ